MSGHAYYEDFISECEDLSVADGVGSIRLSGHNRGRMQRIMSDHKTDKNAVTLMRFNPKYGKKTKVNCFASGCVGSSIRNAITGQRYVDCKVGSRSEDQFFKVGICTGEFGQDPVTLFFESKGAYERHMMVSDVVPRTRNSRDVAYVEDRLKFC
jgi:hypothetical protein